MSVVDRKVSSVSTGRSRWRIIAVGAALYALSGPGQTAGFSVFVDPVTQALDISRGQLSTGYLIATLVAAPSGIWLGRQLDHRNIATVIRLVGVGLAVSLCVTAAAPALWVLTIGILGLRLFGQTGFTLTSSVHVARSITERRGAALGGVIAMGGAAIALTPLVASRVIPHVGWRSTWALLAVVVVASSLCLAIAASRPSSSPAPAELMADPDATGGAQMEFDSGAGFDSRRRAAFAVVAAGYASSAGVATALGFHQIAILEERGLSAGAAAANFLPQSLAAASVALTVGRFVDRVNGRLVIPLCMMVLTVALVSLRMVESSPTALVYGLILGSATAGVGASEGTLLARWLGTDELGRLRGRLMAIIVTASAIAPLAFALLADATGSFTTAASIFAAIPITVGTSAALAPLPEHRSS